MMRVAPGPRSRCSISVNRWYSDSAYHIEQIKVSDGKVLLDSQVDALVSAMALFPLPPDGHATLPFVYQAALIPVISANWMQENSNRIYYPICPDWHLDVAEDIYNNEDT